MENTNKELFEKQLIDDKQFDFLESIRTNRVISVFFELRIVLYLGIMLFTGGLGYLAYQNMGEIGHIAAMLLIFVGILVCFWFIRQHAKPYTNDFVPVTHGYFDYILLLAALLIISLFTYIQVYFGIVKYMLHATSYISAAILFFLAYRYDNRALLSMGITAIAAAVGISITPINWVQGDWAYSQGLYIVYIALGVLLFGIGEFSSRKGIKSHFKFLYQNFGLLLFYIGCFIGMGRSDFENLFAFLTLLSGVGLSLYTWKGREFLFFLYSNIAAYIGLTYLLFQALETVDGYMILAYYFPLSCISYVMFLIIKKSHFSHDR